MFMICQFRKVKNYENRIRGIMFVTHDLRLMKKLDQTSSKIEAKVIKKFLNLRKIFLGKSKYTGYSRNLCA